MKFKIRIYILFLLLLTFCAGYTIASEHIKDDDWKELTDSDKYHYRNKTEFQDYKPPVQRKHPQLDWFGKLIGFFSRQEFKILVWILVIGSLLYVAGRSMINNGVFTRKIKRIEGIQEEEELIENTDWQRKINDAFKNNDLRTAVRNVYMYSLQLLQDQNLIIYRQDKTNRDYIREIDNEELVTDFKKITRQFEYAWFGNYPLTADQYQLFYNDFKRLQSNISRF